MNGFTKTPTNTVWFVAAGSIALGALAFAGPQTNNAVFALSNTAQNVAYSIPIAVRWIWRKENGWTSGPFSLGQWVSDTRRFSTFFFRGHGRTNTSTSTVERTLYACLDHLDDVHIARVFLPDDETNECRGHELLRRHSRQCTHFFLGLVLFSRIRWRALV
jgi:hypothetical protein